MTASPRLFQPDSLPEASGILESHGGEGLVVAGATAVSLMLHHRLIAPRALVSLARVAALRDITVADGALRIGALVTHHQIATDQTVARTLPVVGETFAVVGNHRVRAAATAGGVLAEADHASDPPATLRALDAVVRVHGPNGERRVAVADLITGFYETSLELGEVIAGIEIPIPPAGTVAAYCKYRSTASEDRPCVGVAAVVRTGPDGSCEDLRVCVGAACAVPFRLNATEVAARGRQLDGATVAQIADEYADSVRPIEDGRGSAWYRREMVRVFVARAVLRCVVPERGET